MIKFEWDKSKAESNIKKHGVSFEEARSVFYDEFALQFFDENASTTEDRFLMLGVSDQANLLIVCTASVVMVMLYASSRLEKLQ